MAESILSGGHADVDHMWQQLLPPSTAEDAGSRGGLGWPAQAAAPEPPYKPAFRSNVTAVTRCPFPTTARIQQRGRGPRAACHGRKPSRSIPTAP